MTNWHIACKMWLLLNQYQVEPKNIIYIQQVLKLQEGQCSHSSDPVQFTQYAQYTAMKLPYAIYRYVEVSVLNCIALHCIAILLHIDTL